MPEGESIRKEGKQGMKIYQVVFTDEWSNNYLLGLYGDLDDAIPDINAQLSAYGDKAVLEKGDIKEYPSTFGACFDTDLASLFEGKGIGEDECEGLYGCMVRGFILDSDALADEIERLKGEVTGDVGDDVDDSGRNLA